jgi:hypothetical protein
MTRIERVTSPLPRECSTTEPHGPRVVPALAQRRGVAFGGALSPWKISGAGEGNRTLVVSLEGFCSTIELHPLNELLISKAVPRFAHRAGSWVPARRSPAHACSGSTGGGGWIRTNVGVSQQIYSLPPLTTRAPLRGEPQIMVVQQRLVKPTRLCTPSRSRRTRRHRARGTPPQRGNGPHEAYGGKLAHALLPCRGQ